MLLFTLLQLFLVHSLSQNCFIFIDMSTTTGYSYLNLQEVQALKSNNSVIVASGASFSGAHSSGLYGAAKCIDGDVIGSSSFCHSSTSSSAWLRIDYDATTTLLDHINSVKIYNRQDCCKTRIRGATVHIGCSSGSPPTSAATAAEHR